MYTVDVSGTMLCDTQHHYCRSYDKKEDAFDKATSFTRRRHFYMALRVIVKEMDKEDVYRFEMTDSKISEEWPKKFLMS